MARGKRYKAKNSILSFLAMALLVYFVGLPVLIAALTSYFGSMAEIIINVVDLIPFGKTYYWLTIQIINALGGQITGYAGITGGITLGYIAKELAKGLFTVIIFEAMNLLLAGILDLIEPEGIWNKAKQILLTLIDALIAACLAPLPLNYIFDHLNSLGTLVGSIISALLAVILVGGGIAFFVFLNGLTIGKAVTYVFMKFILMSAARLSVSYISILFILIGWNSGLFGILISGASGLIGIALFLGGMEMMLDAVCGS